MQRKIADYFQKVPAVAKYDVVKTTNILKNAEIKKVTQSDDKLSNDFNIAENYEKPRSFKRLRPMSGSGDSDNENEPITPGKKILKMDYQKDSLKADQSFKSYMKSKQNISKSKDDLNSNECFDSPIRKKPIICQSKDDLKIDESFDSPMKIKTKISKPNTPKSITRPSNKVSDDLNESQFLNEDETFKGENFDHMSLAFLKNEFVMDSKRHRPDHCLFDATTLFVPNDFMSKLTPAMRQWWEMKAGGMNDTLLFFKVGKFYELYHMDAVIAVNELGISFMRGSYAHCGFPEIAFTKMSDQLVQKGYKVARVEQTETVEVMTERSQGRPAKDKVVKREICQIVTPGTRTFSLRNGCTRAVTQDDCKEDLTFDDNVGAMLYAVKEIPVDDAAREKSRFVVEFGVAVVNTNTGKFMVSQFEDDNQRSKLRTMFARFTPNELIFTKGDLSKETQQLFNTTLASVKKEALSSPRQFLSSEEALKRLLESGYFIDTPKTRLSTFGLPMGLTEALSKGDNLGRTPAPEFNLAINSLGGLIYYLERCLIDKYLISIADFVIYRPTDQLTMPPSSTNTSEPFYNHQSNMILDSNALQNLDLLRNSCTGDVEGTLLERLDFTSTPFGKRLLHQWIASPLCHPKAISERQNAISDLMDLESRLNPIRQKLKTLPDLERLMTRIHAVGLTASVADHPDSRAVLYENIKYSRKKINDFISTISALQTIIKIQLHFTEFNFELKVRSNLLKSLTLCKQDHEIGNFPDLEDAVKYFQDAFNHENAKVEGKIIPEKGVDRDYDAAIEEMEAIQKSLDKYLQEQSTLFGCKVNYFGTARNRYQLEIPEAKCKSVPRSYVASSQRKGFKRYETSETHRHLAEMMSAEERRDTAMKNIMNRIFNKFDEYYPLWSRAIDCIAQLDVLMSLSVFSRGVDGGPMTKPDIVELTQFVQPFLSITEGRYPSKAHTQTGEFISNSINLGNSSRSANAGQNRPVMILTGPNMGGKSTLMKQTGLIIILAQLGCYVPAEGPVSLTPVDRLMTRQGASDAIGRGQSTLQVELNEVASIMSYVTVHSFLMVDELGRGTATHDGCALAFAILTNIVDRCNPRTVFSTHFHKLMEDKNLTDKVQLGHMACMLEDDLSATEGHDNDTKLQNITFLYKLTSGSCPKSYGFNVARLADLPEKIIVSGIAKARLFEEETLILEFRRVLGGSMDGRQSLAKEQLKMWQSKFRDFYSGKQ